MMRELTCIMCPRGCHMAAEIRDGESPFVTGNLCPKGGEYAVQEILSPMRNIATSIQVEGGELPLASVRLTRPIPKSAVFDVMKVIRGIKVTAPVYQGTVVMEDVLGLKSGVIVTKTVLPGPGN